MAESWKLPSVGMTSCVSFVFAKTLSPTLAVAFRVTVCSAVPSNAPSPMAVAFVSSALVSAVFANAVRAYGGRVFQVDGGQRRIGKGALADFGHALAKRERGHAAAANRFAGIAPVSMGSRRSDWTDLRMRSREVSRGRT